MSENHINTSEGHDHDDHAGLSKKKIWEVFFILLALTVIEFIIALWVIPKGYMGQSVGNIVYILLTIWKAYYIIAYFMHLKFEKYGLIVAMGISLIFIVYFIVLMLIEGSYLFHHTPNF